MSLNLKTLRAALLGLAVTGALGFGGQQAFATTAKETASKTSCPDRGFDYAYAACRTGCAVGGYCAAGGTCHCGFIP